MPGLRLGTKMLSGVLLVIAGMTGLTVRLGGSFVGDAILQRTVEDMARTQGITRSFQREIHTSLAHANRLCAESPQVKAAAAASFHPVTVAQALASILPLTPAKLLLWVPPCPLGPDNLPAGGSSAATLLVRDGDRGEAWIRKGVVRPASESLFDFGSGDEGSAPLPLELSGLGWPVRPLEGTLAGDPLLSFAEQSNLESHSAVQRAGDLETRERVYQGRSLVASFRSSVYLIAITPFNVAEAYAGTLVAGVPMDRALAETIADAAGLHVTFLRTPPGNGAATVVAGASEGGRSPGGSAARSEFRIPPDLYAERVTFGQVRPAQPGDARPPYQISYRDREFVAQAQTVETVEGADRVVSIVEGDLTGRLGNVIVDLRRTLLGISVLGAVLAILLFTVGTRVWVTRPVDSLSRGMLRIREGDLSNPIEVSSRDELGELAESFNGMLLELRKKEQYMRMVSKSAVVAVESQVTANLASGGERRVVTMLFSDIRGFTTLCEKIDPTKLVHLLNRYFDAMVEIIYRNGGQLDKFIGDAIMAIFDGADHPKAAVLAALEMQSEVRRLDREESLGLKIGVGLHTGEVIAGFVGAKEFMNHTVLGDTVNLAARLEGESKNGRHTQVIVSQSTLDGTGGMLEVERLDKQHVKGKTEAVSMYEVVRLLDESTVVASLKSPQASERIRGALLAGRVGSRDSIGLLVELAADPDEEVAVAALKGLRAKLPEEVPGRGEVAARLLQQLLSESRSQVRASLVSTLGALGDLTTLSGLMPLLADPEARVRANTVEAMQRLGGSVVRATVKPLLHDPNNRVMANAAICLFEEDPDQVREILTAGLRSPDRFQRASASYACFVVASRYPAELLDAEKAKDLDQRGYRVHDAFRQLSGQLTARIVEETDDMVLRNMVAALRCLIGPEMTRSLVAEALKSRGVEAGNSASLDTSFPSLAQADLVEPT